MEYKIVLGGGTAPATGLLTLLPILLLPYSLELLGQLHNLWVAEYGLADNFNTKIVSKRTQISIL